MKLSDSAFEAIAKSIPFSSTAIKLSTMVSSSTHAIGFNHLITKGEAHLKTANLTQKEGRILLMADLAIIEAVVNIYFESIPFLPQGVFDAVVSFIHDRGYGKFKNKEGYQAILTADYPALVNWLLAQPGDRRSQEVSWVNGPTSEKKKKKS